MTVVRLWRRGRYRPRWGGSPFPPSFGHTPCLHLRLIRRHGRDGLLLRSRCFGGGNARVEGQLTTLDQALNIFRRVLVHLSRIAYAPHTHVHHAGGFDLRNNRHVCRFSWATLFHGRELVRNGSALRLGEMSAPNVFADNKVKLFPWLPLPTYELRLGTRHFASDKAVDAIQHALVIRVELNGVPQAVSFDVVGQPARSSPARRGKAAAAGCTRRPHTSSLSAST